MRLLSFFILFLTSLPAQEIISSEEHRFKIETIASELKNPWGMVKLPDGRFLVTERAGELRLIENGKLHKKPISGVPPVFAVGQGGLLDIKLHPDYANNGWLYLAFSKPGPKGGLTTVIRAHLQGEALTDLQTIFEPPLKEYTNANVHFGGRLEFDQDRYLYFSIGDRGDATTPENNAQKLTNVKGKIHRLHDDGKIPEDNPFAQTTGAVPSIWCYGNRNPQGLRIHPKTGDLWESEHGPKGGDELNRILKGANYGWPLITFGINYNGTPITNKTETPGMESPITHWTPSIAVSGIEFYRGDLFPKWKYNLFAGALAHQKLVRNVIENNQVTHQEILLEKSGRIRDVKCFDDGYLYVIYDQPGKIIRLVPVE